MARAHEIGIAADARDFERGIRDGIIDPLEEANDALDDLADAAGDAGTDGARGIERLEDALERAQRETDDLGDKAKRAGDDVRDGMRRAEGGVEDFKDEANSTAREAAASFDGSAESIAETFQEIAANAFSGFGPAGAVAGLAAAAGIGLAIAGFEAANEAEAASRERAAEWAQSWIDAGNQVSSATVVAGRMMEIATNADRQKEAADNAKNWGVDATTAMRAMAGDAIALAAVQDSLNDKSALYTELIKNMAAEDAAAMYGGMATEVGNGTAALERLNGEMAAGRQWADTYSAGLIALIEQAGTATTQVDDLGNTVYTLPDGKQILVNAETGKATENLDTFRGELDETGRKVVNPRVVVSVDSSAYDNWRPADKVAYVRAIRTGADNVAERVLSRNQDLG